MRDMVLIRKGHFDGKELLYLYYDQNKHIFMIDRKVISRRPGFADSETRRKGKLFERALVEERLNITL